VSEAFEAGVDAPAPDGPEEQEQDPRGAARAGAIEPVETEVEEDTRTDVERERDEYLDALRRLQADFENYRKRVDRQFEELAARGATALVRLLLPVLDARCRYFHGARYDERITIETGVLDQGRATIRFGYRVLGEDGERCALGYTEHCVVTPDAKPVRPPAALAAILDRAPRADDELQRAFGNSR